MFYFIICGFGLTILSHYITLMLFKSILVQPSVDANQPVKVGRHSSSFYTGMW